VHDFLVHFFTLDFGNMLTWKIERGSRVNTQHGRRWLAVGLQTLLLSTLLSVPSHAQLKPTIQKLDATKIVRKTGRRDANNYPYWISYSDCTADDELTFNVQIQNPNVNNFEVWAGRTDCSKYDQRQGSLAQCWQVYGKQVTKSPAAITLRAQDIVAQNGPKDGNNGVPGTAKDCNDRRSLELKLYFMYVNDASEVSSNVVTFDQMGIDLEGPIPPSIEKLLPSDDSLIAEWENSDTTMFAGYRLYCADAVSTETNDASASNESSTSTAVTLTSTALTSAGDGSVATLGDAAVESSAPNDAALDTSAQSTGEAETTSVQGCGGTALSEGKYPSDSLRLCGTVDSYSARSGTAAGLRNGRSYAVGVTAIDRLGNESPLSNIDCNTPREVYTFYEDYRSSGGQGGGGFCTLGKPGQKRFPTTGLLLASLALVLAYYRRNSQS
jgi:hypothetical protein